MAAAAHAHRSRLGGLGGDLAAGLRQQMIFWGRDVEHPDGNLLLAQGFEKSKSAGLQSSSCYGLGWQGGRIELHGASAGWFPDDGSEGFLFIRPFGKCYVWRGSVVPVPGEWPLEMLEGMDFARLFDRAIPFLEWWVSSERRVTELLGVSYREACHRNMKRLPKGKPWLSPVKGMEWVERLMVDPESAPRAARRSQALASIR